MSKTKLLFAITQFFKGGAETALLNLFSRLSPDDYEVDFVLFNQLDIPGTLSLVPQIPRWVNIVDAVHLLSGGAPTTESPAPKRLNKLLRQKIGTKNYHWAFHIGEWSTPEFVATSVIAEHKAVWVHSQLDAANYFNASDFFRWLPYFEHCIFASQSALAASISRYPVLASISHCIHNLVDIPSVLRLAQEPFPPQETYFRQNLPMIVTCANVRTEKNHLRQLEAMALLKQQGIAFLWLNVGALPDKAYAETIREAARRHGLASHFLLLDKRDNPYPYMKRANAVAVLSDYESWSLVITEALALGTPVIATKTSGALAQITPHNGILVDFSAAAIAAGLAEILARTPSPRTPPPAPVQAGFEEFEALVRPLPGKRRLLYIMDDANYQSGVQKATFAQMKALKNDYHITLYSGVTPAADTLENCPCHAVLRPSPHRHVPHFYLRAGHVFTGGFSIQKKLARAKQIAATFTGRGHQYEQKLEEQTLLHLMENYDSVIVTSESSAFREKVASLDNPQKIQWIHTDYSCWCGFDTFSKAACQNDEALYRRFDTIVTLSPLCRQSFVAAHPSFAEKTLAIANLLPKKDVLRQAAPHNWFAPPQNGLRLITIGRLQPEKNFPTLLGMARKLMAEAIPFSWTMVGDGPMRGELQTIIHQNGLENTVFLTGQVDNVYPLLAQMDLMVLFSHYEGTPLTIREAQLLGVPTLASASGGIPDMIQHGQNGLLAADESAMYQDICALAADEALLATLKQGAAQTKSPDDDAVAQLHLLFDTPSKNPVSM